MEGKIIDLRVILLGDPNVGKKSMAQRFKSLKSTETKEISLKELEKRNNAIKKVILAELTEEEEKKEQKRLNLKRFSKLFKMEFNNLQVSFYPCPDPVILNFDFDPKDDEDNYEFEKKYKKSIKNIINEVNEIITRPADDQKANIEILFLLCFDLSDFSTFENLVIYFSQINKMFKLIDNNFKVALIGTKVDIKKSMNNEEKESFETFKNNLSLLYYEISTLMFFKFETFFEKLILDNFSNVFPFFNDERYKTIFHNILHTQNDFTKKKRDEFVTFNGVPGSDQYNNNVFEYPKSRRELLKIFSRKNIFNKKIFINKQGMLFPPQKDIKEKLSSRENESKTDRQLKGQYSKSKIVWDIVKNEKVQKALQLDSNKPGYTLGARTNNSLGLKKERKMLRNLKDNEVMDKLDEYIISGSQVLPIKHYKTNFSQEQYQDIYEKNRNDSRKKKSEEREKILDMIRQRHNEVQLKNSKSFNKKIFDIKEKHKKYDIINFNKILEREKERREILNTINTDRDSPRRFFEPRGKFYSPISSISTNKGFTFGLKLPPKAEKKDDPEFPNFQDDFEKLIERNKKRTEIKSFGERLPKYKTDEVGDSTYVMEKQKIFEKKRKAFKTQLLSDFFEDRKGKREFVINKKKEILTSQEKKLKDQIQKSYKTDENYLLKEINYNQIETASPKYSIKGKPAGTLFSKNKDDDDFYGNKRFATISGEEIDIKTRLTKPNFGAIYPRYPAFSFGNAKRFDLSNEKMNKSKSNEKDKDKNSKYEDSDIFKSYQYTQSFLMAQTFMGTGEKLKMEINGYPGPGMYKIKGFADDVISKGNKVNLARLRIQEKEKIKEKEKEKREKLREQWLEERKSILKMGIKDYYSSKISQKIDDNDNDNEKLNLQDNDNDNDDE